MFYTSRLITDQAPKGKRADWAYNIAEVYFIALLEDFVLDGVPKEEYFHDICLCNRDTGEIFYDKLGYIYIELRKFAKKDKELETELDKWLFFLKYMKGMDELPAHLRKPIFEKLFNIAEYTNLTKEEKAMYDSSMKYKWDNKNVRDYEVAEAKKEQAREIAVKLKKEGLSIEFIAETTGLTVEEIEKL